MHVSALFRRVVVAWFAGAILASPLFAREPDVVLPLWPGTPPGETRAKGEEHKLEGRPRPFYQLTDITTPTLVVFHAPADKRNGTAVLVCPGGGMQRLAYEHEGLEVAEWLNSLGLTACVLKYRVPSPAQTTAIDAQRALGLIRAHAAEWKLDSDAIGTVGFSAGGEIGAWLITHHDQRLYANVDATDQLSCRPDFAALVYSGGLLQRDGSIKEPLAGRIKAGLPPVFLAHAFDDSSNETLTLALALKRARVPTEVHVYREGGHGFGARQTGIPTGGWKTRFTEWLGDLGFLDRAPLRAYARQAAAAYAARQAPPRFTESLPEASLDDAYLAQRRLVRALAVGDPIAGFKGAAAAAATQTSLGLDGPLAGVVFRAGKLDGTARQVIEVRPGEVVAVETEVGYITSVDLSYEVLNDEQARGAVESVVPIIELPRSFPNSGPANARNMVASNIGSDRYLVGKPVKAEGFNPDAVAVVLKHDGKLLHETTGGVVAGGQWHNLRMVLNSLTRHGYTIPAGSVILGGALGKIHPGEKGSYEASYGELGAISFELK